MPETKHSIDIFNSIQQQHFDDKNLTILHMSNFSIDDVDDIHPQWLLAYRDSVSPTNEDNVDAIIYQIDPYPDEDNIKTDIHDMHKLYLMILQMVEATWQHNQWKAPCGIASQL